MKKLDLFKLSVYEIKNFINNDMCNDIFSFLKQNEIDATYHQALTNKNDVSTYSTGDDILKLFEQNIKSCKDLKSNINKVFNQCAEDLKLNEKVELTNSWMNIQQKGSTLFRHNHPDSVFSGALFINTDESSSKLYFYNPFSIMTYFGEYKESNSNNANNYSVLPEKGTLYVFPSFLDHGSDTDVNNTDDRTVLSFNSKKV